MMAIPIVKRAVEIFQEEGTLALATKSLYYVKARFFYSPYCSFKIRNLNQDCSLDRLVDFAFTGCFELIKPSQARDEILKLLTILDRMKPKSILEIGTARGGTLFLFSRIASEDASIISVDLPDGQFGGGYPKWEIPLYKSFALANQQIHLIRADSHDGATFEKVKTILNGKEIDFLFVDGDHTYEGVGKDFEMYGSLVKKNGIIAFHDIVVGPPESDGEVGKFWNEIKRRYEHIEIVNDRYQNHAGIGLLFMK